MAYLVGWIIRNHKNEWVMCNRQCSVCCRDVCHRGCMSVRYVHVNLCGHVNCWFWSHWSKYRIIIRCILYLVFFPLYCTVSRVDLFFPYMQLPSHLTLSRQLMCVRTSLEREKNRTNQMESTLTILKVCGWPRARSSHSCIGMKRKCAIYRLILRMSKYGCNGDENELSTCLMILCVKRANNVSARATCITAKETYSDDNGYLPKLDFITVSNVAQD